MKMRCNRAALYEAVQLGSSIVPSRTTTAILQCTKITANAENKCVTVMTTDNELTVVNTIRQVQIEDAGSTVIPADKIASILHESKDETVELYLEDATCYITGQDSKFRIYGHDPDDYPEPGWADVGTSLSVRAEDLRGMLMMSGFAAAKESTRYAIDGVLWEFSGKRLRLVATDGRRLAKVEGKVSAASDNPEDVVSAVVPLKTMAVLERILHDPDEKVDILLGGDRIVARTAVVQLNSNLIQGRFPNYEDVIPSNTTISVKLETEVFRSAVRRVSLLTDENSRAVKLSFSEGNVQLLSRTPEAGDAEINIAAGYKGEPFVIGFNAQYLLDVLRVVGEPEVTCCFIAPDKPGVIKAGKNFLYVIMPVAV